MKKSILASLFFLAITGVHAQEFPGFRSGNYTGVNGVFYNPASIADSRYRFDINLFSLHTSLGNNKASFNLKTMGETLNGDSVSNEIFKGGTGTTSGAVNVDIHGPSFMFNVGDKMSFAVTTRARTMVNMKDIDGNLLNQLADDANSSISFPYTITSAGNMRLMIHSWTEIGASGARIIMDRKNHFLKGGLSLKYLAGVGHAYVSVANLNARLEKDLLGDVYLTNTTGRIATGFGGMQVSDGELDGFGSFNSTGFGADLGFVYEFRPAQETSGARNKYLLKVGMALLDLGKIRYEKNKQKSGAYNIDITGSERFHLDELANEDIDNYNSFFASRPQYFTPAASNSESSYKVSLPSTLQLDADYHVLSGLYANLAAIIPINADNEINSRSYTSLLLTPRFEIKMFGAYLPISYNSLTGTNAGLSLRAGPFFVGSGSIITALIGNSKQADFHLGFRVSGLKRK